MSDTPMNIRFTCDLCEVSESVETGIVGHDDTPGFDFMGAAGWFALCGRCFSEVSS